MNNFKTTIIILSIVFSIGIVGSLYANCDFMAMLTRPGYIMPDIEDGGQHFDCPDEVFDFLKDHSTQWTNNDGYGVIYYRDENYSVPESQRFYQDGFGTYYTDSGLPAWQQEWQIALDNAVDAVGDPTNEAVIVLGHARNGTGGYGNHPFWFEVKSNGEGEYNRTYTFQHNGDCSDLKQDMFDLIIHKYGEQWFKDHPSNWAGNQNNAGNWIDSELLFHFIMAHILEANGDVISGIINALNYDGIYGNFAHEFHYYWSDNRINFVLSDGEALYVFRNTPTYSNTHKLSYKEFGDSFVSLKTDNTISGGTQVAQYSLVKIPRSGNIVIYDDIFDKDAKLFASGWNWVSFPRLERDESINEPVDIVPVLESIENFGGIYNIEVEYYDSQVINYTPVDGWHPEFYDIQSTWLYKIKVEPEDDWRLIVPGTKMEPDYTLSETLPGSPYSIIYYNWLGYWQTDSQNIKDAFGDLWQYVKRVKAQDWYYDRCENYRGESNDPELPSSSTEGKTMEYGKGYMVHFGEDIDNFAWNHSGNVEEPVEKQEPEYFTYEEQSDYVAIDVLDIPEDVIEIGVIQGRNCVGAVVVENSAEQILVYAEEGIPLTLEYVTERGGATNLDRYTIYNPDFSTYNTGQLIGGRFKYAAVILKDAELLVQEQTVEPVILHTNYPNPSNPETTFSFTLAHKQDVELSVYNIRGQKVRTLYDGSAEEGAHSVVWDGKDSKGRVVSSGVYFYKLKTDELELTDKMILLK